MKSLPNHAVSLQVLALSLLGTQSAWAQRASQDPVAPAPVAAPSTQQQLSTPRVAPTPVAPQATELPEIVHAQPGGLTADQAARRALEVSFGVEAARAGVRVAELQQREAGWAMVPNLNASFRYTRLSDIVPGTIPFFDTAGCLNDLGRCMTMPESFQRNVVLQQPILNNMTFRLSLAIPVSDMVLRLREFYLSAGHQAEARRLDLETQRATAALQARESYFEYVRAVGSLAASEQALALTQRRAQDVAHLSEVGMVAPADLFVVRSAVASSELRVIQTRNLVSLMELQLRQRLRLAASEPLVIGESIEELPQVPSESLANMVDNAVRTRPEVLSIERQAHALDATRRATVAGMIPSLTIAGNLDAANPNQRIFPQREGEFVTTWDVTAQISWSPNSLLAGTAATARIDAQRSQILAQMAQLRDGLETEVRAQYNSLVGARASIEAARVALIAATETHRVRRERLSVGATTQTELSDAETQLFSARVQLLNAYVDLRLALVRLRRAAGHPDSALTAGSNS
ncbi:MAG: TolC family protein [Deltaproteobacteria bacterium]|nr:TolC family protein [Deltaproteobacteria bacterium]